MRERNMESVRGNYVYADRRNSSIPQIFIIIFKLNYAGVFRLSHFTERNKSTSLHRTKIDFVPLSKTVSQLISGQQILGIGAGPLDDSVT